MNTIYWAQSAQHDLESIAEYIMKDSVVAALDVVDKIRKSCNRLKTQPNSGRVIPARQGIQKKRIGEDYPARE